eukprot:g10590.t1
MLALRTKDQEVAPSLETYPLALLAKSSEEEVTEVSTCNQCGEALVPLLICENFCKSCASTIHIKCLSPPLEQVPSEDWFCPLCTHREKRKAPKAKAKAKAKTVPKAKEKAKAKAKATIAKGRKS